MSISTLIEWADDSINPVMGCGAPCELRPTPSQAREIAMEYFTKTYPNTDPAEITRLLDGVLAGRNATEIYQFRDRIADVLRESVGGSLATASLIKKAYKSALDQRFICYAHRQTMMRGSDITKPGKRIHPGFPVQFEILTKFPGRMAEAAMRPDLYGMVRTTKPWLDFLPRIFFISDMGDASSEEIDFAYLKQEIIDVISTTRGRQHIWLWLTKMPWRMAGFADWLKNEHHLKWPDHLVPMTSVTSKKTVVRVRQLMQVPARFRGLSVEPLWENVTLPLAGIDWCICGGQSGPGSKPFDVAWIRSLHTQCRKSGTAFFVKQLGARPVSGIKPIKLDDEHGGNWNEWPVEFRLREMPSAFYNLGLQRFR